MTVDPCLFMAASDNIGPSGGGNQKPKKDLRVRIISPFVPSTLLPLYFLFSAVLVALFLIFWMHCFCFML